MKEYGKIALVALVVVIVWDKFLKDKVMKPVTATK
jgi:hypothetical protein